MQSLTARSHGSTQKRRATLTAARNTTPAPPAPDASEDVRARTDRVRALLREHLPLGVKAHVAEQLGLRRESVTRQLDPQRTERLTEDVAILGQLWLEQVAELDGIAREVRELRYAGTDTISLRLPAGVDTWTFTVNRRTGEVR